MGLFRKNEKKKGSKNDLLSEEIFGYMQSEGFFPEMEEKDKGETDVSRIHFKFQGTNVTLETAEGNYVRIVMGFDLSHSDTDYFNLQCAASQIMYEMKAVKIVAAVKWIQFSVETFVQSAGTFTPFLKPYLDILSEAVGRHRILYSEFMEDKEPTCQTWEDELSSAEDNAMERAIEDAINSHGNKTLKN